MVSTEDFEVLPVESFLLFLDELTTKLEIKLQNNEAKSSELCKVMVFAQRDLLEKIWDYVEERTETLTELFERIGEA